MYILGMESSCDETSAAVVEYRDGVFEIKSNIVASQIETHRLYGGVVPEIASRAHIEAVSSITTEALETAGITLKDLDCVAVTTHPGLIGALLVGVNFAKSLAFANDIPLVSVNHIHGHISAAYLTDQTLEPKFLALVVSGGHTSIYVCEDHLTLREIGTTRDDAAGEAFDKIGRVIGMPYPGGAAVDKAAQQGDENKYVLPRSKPGENPYNMSFSGLKTAALNLIHHAEQVGEEIDIPSLCAGFTAAVSDTLVPRVVRAIEETGCKKIAVAGGVAANSRIRRDLLNAAEKLGAEVFMPPLKLCGDNAAMIGAQAYYEYLAGNVADMSLNAYATKSILGEKI